MSYQIYKAKLKNELTPSRYKIEFSTCSVVLATTLAILLPFKSPVAAAVFWITFFEEHLSAPVDYSA